MEQLEVISLLVSKLEKAGIRYFITGSIASSYYGIPRFTHDIDVVLTLGTKDVDQIIKLFIDDGYISKEGILEAFSGSGMFNFIHSKTGLKIDFWVDRGDSFTRSCFHRTRREELTEGFWAVMASPEDVLLHKVYWSHLMPSERQIGDAQGIIAVQGSRLDLPYIEKWAKEMGIEEEIKTLLSGGDLPNLT
jgi:hypothetical protein